MGDSGAVGKNRTLIFHLIFHLNNIRRGGGLAGRNFSGQMGRPVASAVLVVFAGGSCTTAGREGRITIGALCPHLNMVSGALGFGIGGRPGYPGA